MSTLLQNDQIDYFTMIRLYINILDMQSEITYLCSRYATSNKRFKFSRCYTACLIPPIKFDESVKF